MFLVSLATPGEGLRGLERGDLEAALPGGDREEDLATPSLSARPRPGLHRGAGQHAHALLDHLIESALLARSPFDNSSDFRHALAEVAGGCEFLLVDAR